MELVTALNGTVQSAGISVISYTLAVLRAANVHA
jgi:hypothetical protein